MPKSRAKPRRKPSQSKPKPKPKPSTRPATTAPRPAATKATKAAPTTTTTKAKTEGQRLLLELAGTEAELAARVGCGAAVVGHWRRGRRIPGEAHRHKLELLFGIPRRSWDVAAGAEVVPEPEPKVAEDAEPEADPAATLSIAKAQIDTILEALNDKTLTDGASAKLRDTLSKLLALRARLERDRDLLEDRVVREHPEWARVRAAILGALRPYPDAARAVAEALQ
jgi:transcriptional regulator with XRE-family HTH domain